MLYYYTMNTAVVKAVVLNLCLNVKGLPHSVSLGGSTCFDGFCGFWCAGCGRELGALKCLFDDI